MNQGADTPPLVLLHGFTGGPQSFGRVRELLRPPWSNATVWAPQLVGHGEQPALPELDAQQHSFEAEVQRLARAHEMTLGSRYRKAVLVGYSLGARLALGLALERPESFERAILIGVNPGLDDDASRAKRQQDDERLAQLAEQAGLEAFLEHWQALPLFSTQTTLPASVLRAQANVRRRNTAFGLAFSLRSCSLARMPNYLPRLPSVAFPVHLVAGELDTRFVGLAHHMSSMIPCATLHVVPGCGHNVLLEAPAVIAALIQSAPC